MRQNLWPNALAKLCGAALKALRMRQGVYQISAQQQNNDSEQNHTVQLLLSIIPENRLAAGTNAPAS